MTQSECGPWVGLSVVHLGDRDVPNALVFIDKYTQVIFAGIKWRDGITALLAKGHFVEFWRN